MSTPKHSPLPWRACKAGACQCGQIWSSPIDACIVTAYGEIEDRDKQFIVVAAHSEWGDGKDMIYGVVPEAMRDANTRLIVRAVNSHDALLAAAKEIISVSVGAPHWHALEKLKSAIAKAEALPGALP
jgi:hypothetical protein